MALTRCPRSSGIWVLRASRRRTQLRNAKPRKHSHIRAPARNAKISAAVRCARGAIGQPARGGMMKNAVVAATGQAIKYKYLRLILNHSAHGAAAPPCQSLKKR